MSIIFLEHMEEELTHVVQEGDINVPVFGKFSVIWIVQQKCWEVVGECVVHLQLAWSC